MPLSIHELEKLRKKEWKYLLYKRHVILTGFSFLIFLLFLLCLLWVVVPTFMTSMTQFSFFLESGQEEGLKLYITSQSSKYFRILIVTIILLAIMAVTKYLLVMEKDNTRINCIPFYDAYLKSFPQKELRKYIGYKQEEFPFEYFNNSGIYENNVNSLNKIKRRKTCYEATYTFSGFYDGLQIDFGAVRYFHLIIDKGKRQRYLAFESVIFVAQIKGSQQEAFKIVSKNDSKEKEQIAHFGNRLITNNEEFNNKLSLYSKSTLVSEDIISAVLTIYNTLDSEVVISIINDQLTISLPQCKSIFRPKAHVAITKNTIDKNNQKVLDVLKAIKTMHIIPQKGHSIGE